MSNLRENAFSVYFLCFYLYNPMILRYSVNEEKSGLQVRGKIVGKLAPSRARAFTDSIGACRKVSFHCPIRCTHPVACLHNQCRFRKSSSAARRALFSHSPSD